MHVVTLTAIAGPDGRLRLDLPATAGAEYEVAVVVAPKSAEKPKAGGWPPGYLEAVVGSISDPAFRRYPQGEFETREPLE
jgi:hypothetical protein